jgi:hypothetical protein
MNIEWWLNKIPGFNTMKCNICNHIEDFMGSIHGRDEVIVRGYQCQECAKIQSVRFENSVNVRELGTQCECGGEMLRETILKCPNCKSTSVEYRLKYIT